ncbi:MAG: DUF2238 domain-containing protein [Bacteroidia bacterium]|nr:DUF2238 domain-containing protein [Bacteroidia bacterium]
MAKSKFKIALLTIFILAVLGSAVNPLSGENWFLELLPVIIFVPLFIYLGERFRISDGSYLLIFVYMIMPVIQAHYGVGYVPIGFELSTWFNTTRNVFDRFTHFFYGFLLFYPLYEMIKYEIGNRKFMNYMIPAALLLGMASVYEILEWLVFEFSGPRLSFLFIGAQDDFYDTPKDMAMTFIGVFLVITIMLISKKIFHLRRVAYKSII